MGQEGFDPTKREPKQSQVPLQDQVEIIVSNEKDALKVPTEPNEGAHLTKLRDNPLRDEPYNEVIWFTITRAGFTLEEIRVEILNLTNQHPDKQLFFHFPQGYTPETIDELLSTIRDEDVQSEHVILTQDNEF